MRSIPQLPRPRRRYLIMLGRKSREPATALRFLAIAKLAAPGKPSPSQVARDLGVVRSTVWRAGSRYLAEGIDGLYDHRCSNGCAKVDDRYRSHLGSLLYSVPTDCGWERPTWTRELLDLEMQERGFEPVSACTMGRALKAIRARLGRPKPIVLCPWARRRRQRVLRQLQQLAAGATDAEPVFYVDEVDIHLNPKIGLDWMPRGFQRTVVTPGRNEKRYVAGALDAATGRLTCVDAERKNSSLFCQLLWRLVATHKGAKRLHIILDNYKIHSSRQVANFLAQFKGRIVLHYLPPYCPDHNRIERVWLDLHANVTRNHRHRTIDDLMAHVRAFVAAYSRRRVRSPSLRKEIRCAA